MTPSQSLSSARSPSGTGPWPDAPGPQGGPGRRAAVRRAQRSALPEQRDDPVRERVDVPAREGRFRQRDIAVHLAGPAPPRRA
ncbi:hypothetical protein [Streptomyces sp.]|uniref:hypothetical protein n=1 Tax=Streptomyces sp. TaxID=1931 RepID=UPI002F418822